MVLRTGLTIDEFLRLPETRPASELIDGEAIQKPMTKRDHWRIARTLTAALDSCVRKYGGDAGPEPTIPFRSVGAVLVPDVAYWAHGRPQGTRDEALPPTLAVEIRSPGQSLESLRGKCRFYVANGVDVAWLIDPDGRTVEVFDTSAGHEQLPPDGVLASLHVPGIELALADLFSELDRES
jgi:Uma2 family endonuclease